MLLCCLFAEHSMLSAAFVGWKRGKGGHSLLAVLCHRPQNALAIGGSSETACIPSEIYFTLTSPLFFSNLVLNSYSLKFLNSAHNACADAGTQDFVHKQLQSVITFARVVHLRINRSPEVTLSEHPSTCARGRAPERGEETDLL